MRKYAVLKIPRKEICASLSLEIEGKILLMLTASKMFFRRQDEAQIKQKRNKYMGIVQNKWDFILKKIVPRTVEIMTPVSTTALCLAVEFTSALDTQNSISRKTLACQFTPSCGYWLPFTSLSIVK